MCHPGRHASYRDGPSPLTHSHRRLSIFCISLSRAPRRQHVMISGCGGSSGLPDQHADQQRSAPGVVLAQRVEQIQHGAVRQHRLHAQHRPAQAAVPQEPQAACAPVSQPVSQQAHSVSAAATGEAGCAGRQVCDAAGSWFHSHTCWHVIVMIHNQT